MHFRKIHMPAYGVLPWENDYVQLSKGIERIKLLFQEILKNLFFFSKYSSVHRFFVFLSGILPEVIRGIIFVQFVVCWKKAQKVRSIKWKTHALTHLNTHDKTMEPRGVGGFYRILLSTRKHVGRNWTPLVLITSCQRNGQTFGELFSRVQKAVDNMLQCLGSAFRPVHLYRKL